MAKLICNNNDILTDIDTILFDKDGTLIDLHHYWVSMIQLRSEHLVARYQSRNNGKLTHLLSGNMGVDLVSGRMKPEGPVGIKPRHYIVHVVAETLSSAVGEVTEEEVEEIFKEVDLKTSQNLHPHLKLLPGVADLLKSIKLLGIKTAIVSTDLTDRAAQAMSTLGLMDYFDGVYGGDLVRQTKPSGDLALLAMNELNTMPEKCAVVGDHPVDVQMGHHAGVKGCIGVLTGMVDRDAFESDECILVDTLNSIRVIPH